MGSGESFGIAGKWKGVLSFWFLQWVLLCLALVLLVSLGGGMTLDGAVAVSIAATVWAGLISFGQLAFVLDADKVGGAREVGRLRRGISRLAASLLATLLCLHIWWLIIGLGFEAAGVYGDTFTVILLGGTGICFVGGLVGWSMVFWGFLAKGRREERYALLAKRLLLGTGVCAGCCLALGFFGVLIGGDADVLVAVLAYCIPAVGGGAVAMLGCVLYLTRLARARAPWYETHCAACGYDLSGNLTVTQCSECGSAWKGGLEVIRGA
ncbi:MAG: hypothetical protein KF705_08140 [Phycisphaeraceae bacterium]|nr:hypothetical protein [Phycisphaeraceae bacterium]